MGIVANYKIIKLTSRMFNEFKRELNELILGATDEHVKGTGWDGSIRDLHNSHLTEQVRAAFTHLAADLISAFEKCDAQSEQIDAPTDADTSTLSEPVH
jgi:hypothetical protein